MRGALKHLSRVQIIGLRLSEKLNRRKRCARAGALFGGKTLQERFEGDRFIRRGHFFFSLSENCPGPSPGRRGEKESAELSGGPGNLSFQNFGCHFSRQELSLAFKLISGCLNVFSESGAGGFKIFGCLSLGFL